jgi:hypothetical protein
MFDRCKSRNHDEGEPDERIVGFYEQLRLRFPDYPPYAGDSPWMSMPLGIGTDHVIMNMTFAPRSDAALSLITELAAQYRLVVWDPQSQDAYLPGQT